MGDLLQTITVDLNKTEADLLSALAHERGLNSASDALHALLSDAMMMYDELWDKTFAESQDLLGRLADEAHADILAGRIEDFDPDAEEA